MADGSSRKQATGFWAVVLVGLVLAVAFLFRDKLGGVIVVPAAPPNTQTVTCERVIDGDSLVIRQDGQAVEVRLEGIDCPEFGQPFRDEAKAMTAQLCQGQPLELEVIARDKYGRPLVRLYVDGREVNELLVRSGLAWQYGRDGRLTWAESQARAQKVGIWAQPSPVPPWEWRATRK